MSPEDDEVKVSFRMQRSLRTDLHEIAKSKHVTASHLLRQYAIELIEKEKKKKKKKKKN